MATAEELKRLWIQAGGNPQNAALAAAVALAESGGNANAKHKNTNGSEDRGFWQINTIHGSQSSFDPLQNAKAAVKISNNGANWRPWCVTYTDKACGSKGGTFDPFSPLSSVSKFLGQAGVNGPPNGDLQNIGGPPGSGTGGSGVWFIGGMIDSIWGNIGMTINIVMNNFVYAMMVLLGLAAILIGVQKMTGFSPIGSTVGALKKAL